MTNACAASAEAVMEDGATAPIREFPRGHRSRTLAAMEGDADDNALMLRYRDGDLEAFEILYQRHRAPLYRYLARQSGDREAGNDLFQEVWSRVIRSRDRYEPRARFATFLYHVAHNAVVDHHRRRKRRQEERCDSVDDLAETIFDPDSAGPERIAAGVEAGAALRRAIAALPPEQRDAFLLYEETGLGLEDIARITAVGTETVKSRLRYAVAKLRRALHEERAVLEG